MAVFFPAVLRSCWRPAQTRAAVSSPGAMSNRISQIASVGHSAPFPCLPCVRNTRWHRRQSGSHVLPLLGGASILPRTIRRVHGEGRYWPRSGLIGCPCPVPVSLMRTLPSSMTPMLIHFRISPTRKRVRDAAKPSCGCVLRRGHLSLLEGSNHAFGEICGARFMSGTGHKARMMCLEAACPLLPKFFRPPVPPQSYA